MIEDRPTSTLTVGSRSVTTSDTITAVPLQFTIKIYTSAASCSDRPSFTSAAPTDGQAFSVAASNMFQQNLVVSSSTSVNKFTVVGLTNAVTSSTVTSSAGNTYSYSVSWTATSEYMGANVLCFSAEDTTREESAQRCVYVQVTDSVTTAAIVTTVESTTETTTADVTTVSASTVHMTTNAAGTTTGTNPCLSNNGNCSDICTWNGGDSYQCSCSNACWHLAADQRNCIPQVHFECGTKITASVEKCATSGPIALNSYDATSPPPGCAPTENATHNTFAFGYNQCGTIVTESASDITYNNSVRMLISTGASTITRESWYSVNVVCSFPKFGNLTGLFDPTDNLVNFLAVPGLGFFTFSFKFFVDSTYQSVYTTEPVIYPLNADVYFALTATGGSGLSLFTQNCSARPDEASSSVSYPLISDGCLQDSTMRTYTAPNAMQNRFSIKAFRFLQSIPGLTNETNVIISCSVIICVGNAPSTRCSRGCINSPSSSLVGRRRRFVDSGEHDRYRRDSRPVQTNETVIETSAQLLTSTRFLVVEEKQATEVSISWLLILLAVGAAVGVAAALGICCRLCFICAVRRRKRKGRDAEGRSNDAFEPAM
nr:oncoprotein-induced transcript 3 protein-like [Ciona intestinalis]|eukprot:XP_018671215.2 oncoprotein-induced transcript 3 protein-like [Ciona intestinalis]